VAEIVPVGEGVDVMAHVSPRDIESVAVGQKAGSDFNLAAGHSFRWALLGALFGAGVIYVQRLLRT
jgi:hypothetical protein